jgi:hypothetical protein
VRYSPPVHRSSLLMAVLHGVNLDMTIGAGLLGTVVSAMYGPLFFCSCPGTSPLIDQGSLYGVTCVQAWIFFSQSQKSDGRWLKLLVGVLLDFSNGAKDRLLLTVIF